MKFYYVPIWSNPNFFLYEDLYFIINKTIKLINFLHIKCKV